MLDLPDSPRRQVADKFGDRTERFRRSHLDLASEQQAQKLLVSPFEIRRVLRFKRHGPMSSLTTEFKRH